MKIFGIAAFATLLIGASAAPNAEPNLRSDCLPGQIYYKRTFNKNQQCRCPSPQQYYDYSKYQCLYPAPPPVYTTPAYTPPAPTIPVYTPPVYTPPTPTTPAYTPPAPATPAYTPPAYTTPAPPAYTTPAAPACPSPPPPGHY